MHIEFLEEGAEDCPLIRIFGTRPQEFADLLHVFSKLSGGLREVEVHKIPGVQSDCSLRAISASEDKGVERVAGNDFVWSLTPAKWLVVEGLTEPFTESSLSGAHQWLSGPEARFGLNISNISVVLSFSE